MTISPTAASSLVDTLASSDRQRQGLAYQQLLTATQEPVGWAYDIWPSIVEGLGAADNRRRSICAQLLANLAASSDPEARIMNDLDALASVMADDRFVTARHATQSFWRAGLGGDTQHAAVAERLARRFRSCTGEKHTTLVRADVIEALARLHQAGPNEYLTNLVEDLLANEADTGSCRRYAAVWRNHTRHMPTSW